MSMSYGVKCNGWSNLWKFIMRVNARLDETLAAKLSRLQSLTGLSASDVLKRAIDCLHKEHMASVQNRLDSLLSSEFIGCAEGPQDLASEYKRYLASDLAEKHGPS